MRTARAYSLVEFVLVMAILGTFAAIAGPRYSNSLALYRAQAAAQRLAADLNLARWQAKGGSVSQSVVFSGNTYSMPGTYNAPNIGTGPAGTAYAVDLSAEPYQAKLTLGAVPVTITFDRYGQPSTGGTLTVTSGVATRTVTLDANTGLAGLQ